MAAQTNGNDQAFPLSGKNSDAEAGLSKREHFAALALQGLLATPEDPSDQYDGVKTFADLRKHFARKAVEYADDLIAALNE